MAELEKETRTDREDAARRLQEDRLASEILDYARQTLTVELRFLDAALNRPRLFVLPEQGIAIDGNVLGYDPRFILQSYQAEPNRIARAYLHTVLHCVFRHVWQAASMERALWDLACDMTVEYVICGLDAPAVRCGVEEAQREELDILKKELGQVTAERIYRYFRESDLSSEQLKRLSSLFYADEHFLWYTPEPLQSGEVRAGGNQGGRRQGESENGKQTESGSSREEKDLRELRDQNPSAADSQEEWQEISRRMQTELEMAARKKGKQSGGMVQTLKAVNRERYDYAAFLRKFAVMGEQIKFNPDEFDYIFYTYGLRRYGNLPLIEPLEYSDDRHVKEFVIAIDTSGSVQGPIVQAFVQKTYNILQTTGSFAARVNVHIIQCDQEIRDDIKITSRQEFEGYLHSMKLKGFGGTDFRPVFRCVDKLIQNKEFHRLGGLIYFTDGRGEYPRKKPPYETAFVFLDGADNDPKTPPWAIQMTLQREEIEKL